MTVKPLSTILFDAGEVSDLRKRRSQSRKVTEAIIEIDHRASVFCSKVLSLYLVSRRPPIFRYQGDWGRRKDNPSQYLETRYALIVHRANTDNQWKKGQQYRLDGSVTNIPRCLRVHSDLV